jgi:pimeloyl-ACP methyl ester carboxylesterase
MPFVTRGRDRIFYERAGEGPALLWHTGGCGDHTMWRDAGYVEAMPGHTHLLMDHRGHGRSSVPRPDAHQMSDYVDDVVAVLNDANVERAAMVGYSFGVDVAFATGFRDRDRLDAIVGLDGVPRRGLDTAALRADQSEVRSRGTREVIEEIAAAEPEAPPAWLVANLLATPTEVFAGSLDALASAQDEWPAAAGPDLPIHLIVSTHDDDQWVDLARQTVTALPRGSVTLLAGLGHLQAFWRTDLTVAPMRDFLGAR